jgi:hypothetical protein
MLAKDILFVMTGCVLLRRVAHPRNTVGSAAAADFPKWFSLLDLEFVEKGAEVYRKWNSRMSQGQSSKCFY